MNYTEEAIKDAFWHLLEEKPYNKITVKDIVDYCRVNRNTFYYHFHDIPALLEHIIKEHTDFLIQSYSKFGSPIDCIIPLVQYCTKRKKAILHIYNSIHRELFLEDLEKIALYTVSNYINTVTSQITIQEKNKLLLIRFYKCILVGVALDWLNQKMSYDLLSAAINICEIFGGTGKQALLNNVKL